MGHSGNYARLARKTPSAYRCPSSASNPLQDEDNPIFELNNFCGPTDIFGSDASLYTSMETCLTLDQVTNVQHLLQDVYVDRVRNLDDSFSSQDLEQWPYDRKTESGP